MVDNMTEEIMAEKITLEPAEPQYIIPPHPTAAAPREVQSVAPEATFTAENTLTDLAQKAVAGLRGELMAELQLSKGDAENAKNEKLSAG
jgi:hypothetical protein